VLVEPVEEKEVKKGGIIIPDSAKEKPTEGVVRALGTNEQTSQPNQRKEAIVWRSI